MKLLRAQEKDSELIKSFYHNQVIGGIVDYRLERPGSFFDHYRTLTKDYSTYLMKDSDGKILAMASVLFRRGYLNHQEQSIGYVTDLRVSPSRKAILQWAQLFVAALKREMRDHECEYLFSALEIYENQAYNALIRPKNRKSHLPRYHLFRKFYNVALVGRSFFRQPRIPSVKIDRAKTNEIEEICDYLKQKSVRRPLFFLMDPEELQRRFDEWPNFSVENFFVARNHQGKIVGCLAPWNNQDVQQWVVDAYHDKSRRVFQTSQTLSSFRLMKPLPAPSEYFSIQFITHAAFENSDIFYCLIDRAYDETDRKEILVYPNFIGDYHTRPPQGYLWWKVPFGFYSLLKKGQQLPAFLRPNPFNPPPEYNYAHF